MRLQLLEDFVLRDAAELVTLPVGMQRVLAFLALRGPSHRCVVAGTLWPEVGEPHALASLRTSIWRLNRMVPGAIAVDGARLGTPTGMSVDIREQEFFATQLLRNQALDPDLVAAQLDSLWPRDLLPGWYDDWVVFERERLGQLRLHALEQAAVLMTRTHRLQIALQLALEAVRGEPLRETSNAALIQVYLAEGNIADAVHHYDVFSQLLLRELGFEPSAALRDLVPRQLAR
jgi:DNA-binding SARP family transcriptional activator